MSVAFSKRYEIGKPIGSGGNSCVYACVPKVSASTHMCAAKFVRTNDKTSREAAHLMMLIGAKNVVQTREMFVDKGWTIFVQEMLAKGTLRNTIEDHGVFSETHARAIILQIAHGLHSCHSRNIMHGDVRPNNVMFDADNNAKLIDFEESELCFPGEHVPVSQLPRSVCYATPELMTLNQRGQHSDVWALGVLAYILLHGRFPFEIKEYTKTGIELDKILHGPLSVGSQFDESAHSFLHHMLERDWQKRCTIEECINHPFLYGVPAIHA